MINDNLSSINNHLLEKEKNLSLNEMKNAIFENMYEERAQKVSPFLSLLWNINTINDIKFSKLREILNELSRNEMKSKTTNPIDSKKQYHKKVKQVDLIALVEFGKKPANCFNINGYTLFTSLRHDRKGGGIGVYVKNTYNSNIIFTEISRDIEAMMITVD